MYHESDRFAALAGRDDIETVTAGTSRVPVCKGGADLMTCANLGGDNTCKLTCNSDILIRR